VFEHPVLAGLFRVLGDGPELCGGRIVTLYFVWYTSLVFDADNEDEAIDRAMDSSGGHWEAVEHKEGAHS
jgi:hypothetical protein